MQRLAWAALLGLVLLGSASAQREKGRRHRHDAGDEQVSSEFGWLNSLEAGREQAKKTGKPIMLVIRCIP